MGAPTTRLLLVADSPRKAGPTFPMLTVPSAVRYPPRSMLKTTSPAILVEEGLMMLMRTELLVML